MITKYVAFLRGINVGGKKVIKMEELSRIFRAAGFTHVKTLIQSGNVLFNSPADDIAALKSAVENKLKKELGYEVEVFLLTHSEVVSTVNSDPFKGFQADKKTKFYISLLSENPGTKIKLPLFSDFKEVELLRIDGNKAYILSHEVEGRHGFPSNFLEKISSLPATTRNWNTFVKLSKE